MNVVIPMAGQGKRFVDAGYKEPKPLIDVDGAPMIARVIDNIDPSEDCTFTFICQKSFIDEYGTDFNSLIDSTKSHIKTRVLMVDGMTEGAACTVLLAEEFINNDEELIIANCDQLVFESDFNSILPPSLKSFRKRKADGGIISFLNNSPKWSYIRLCGDTITEVVEKQVVSDVATVGIYYFRCGELFVSAAKSMITRNFRVNNEFYVAPVFNELICRKMRILPYMVNGMIGLGTPEDLQEFLQDLYKKQ